MKEYTSKLYGTPVEGRMMAHQLVVDGDACTACGTCVDVCFVNAIGWDDGRDQPTLAYPDDCQVCCVCERACPESALEIVPDWAGRRPRPYLSAAAQEAAR
jgi:MinD superfamily P-loop ATPase